MATVTSGDFENYTKTSKDYDSCRQPVGVDVILGAIAHVMGDRPLKKASIVDIGCGTGNYALALSSYVGQVTGIEYNSGMYEQAVKKTEHAPNVSIQQGSATNIPLPDGYCDVVICTLVLHHLPDSVPPNYPGSSQAIKEVYRILKDKGAYIINTISHEQISKSYYFFRMVPQAMEKLKKTFPPVNVLHDQLSNTGFKVQSILAHCHESIIDMDIYKNVQNPFDEKWRNTVSVWAMATPEEIEETLTNWRQRIENNTAEAFIEESETARKRIGQTTTIVAYKELQ